MIPTGVPRVLNLQYRRLLDDIDAVRHHAAVGDHPCKAECAACCHGPFDVGPADIWLLIEGIAALGPDERRRALGSVAAAVGEERAVLGLRAATPLGVESVGERAFDEMCDALADRPCPLLADQRCLVYGSRPQPCRLVGARYTHGDDELDVGCPVDLTTDQPPIALDFVGLDGEIARLEARLELPGTGTDRTTIAAGLESVLKKRAPVELLPKPRIEPGHLGDSGEAEGS